MDWFKRWPTHWTLLITPAICTYILYNNNKKIAAKREVELQQEKCLDEKNQLWDILKANLFPVDSQSPMAPLFGLSHSKSTSELISEPQDNFEPLIQRLITSEDEAGVTLSGDLSLSESDLNDEKSTVHAYKM